jgi:long-chain fatty acid transport protein
VKLTAELNFRSFLSASLLFIITSSSFASFEPLPVGGRAAGMGEAYSAIVDDVYSMYYNPAGVLQIDRPEIGSY